MEEVKKLLGLLQNEKEEKKPFVLFFTLAAYTGCRKGELLGAEWKDFDFDNNTFSIQRGYYYDCFNHTHYTDTPKTKTSRRTLKLPAHIMETLKEYRQRQNTRREICGGSWVETDRIFTTWKGETMPTTSPKNFLQSFCKRTEMREVNIHSFRHFNAIG